MKAAYEPVLVSFEVGDHIYAWITNDSAETVEGNLEIGLYDVENSVLENVFVQPVRVRPGESMLVTNLDEFGQFLRKRLIYGKLMDRDGKIITRVGIFADIERHLHFPDSKLSLTRKGDELTITSDVYAHCIDLTGESSGNEFGFFFSDNYFQLMPGEVKKVTLHTLHTNGIITAKEHYSTAETKIIF